MRQEPTANQKKCTCCGETKKESEFHRRGSRFQNICKLCRNEKAKIRNSKRSVRVASVSAAKPKSFNADEAGRRLEALIPTVKKICGRYAASVYDYDFDDLFQVACESILVNDASKDDTYLLNGVYFSILRRIQKSQVYNLYVGEYDGSFDNTSFNLDVTELRSRSVEDEIIERETAFEISREISRIIATLPDENRELLSAVSSGVSLTEIGRSRGVSKQAISSRVKNLEKHFKPALCRLQAISAV